MARPQIQIDTTQFENLCKLQCTLSEIAGWFGCSEDTIERWCKREYGKTFADVFAIKREAGRISLRRAQFKLAEKSAPMAIFLGKQYLHQRDVQSVEFSNDVGETAKEIADIIDKVSDGA